MDVQHSRQPAEMEHRARIICWITIWFSPSLPADTEICGSFKSYYFLYSIHTYMCVYIYMWYIYVYLYIYMCVCCMCTYICDILKYSIIYSIIIIMPIFPVVLTGCSVDRPWISGNRDSTTNCSCTGSTTRTFMARPKRRPDMVTWWWLGLC